MIITVLLIASIFLIAMFLVLKAKNLDIWIFSYLMQKNKRQYLKTQSKTRHIIFCLVDHFEPYWRGASAEIARKRIEVWVKQYPLLAKKHVDACGNHPQHTFFYPLEQYQEQDLNMILSLFQEGFAEVEIHLHHDQDTEHIFKQKIVDFKNVLVGKQLLSSDVAGNIYYGFIHGDWALDNARPDGKYCGLNNELQLLKQTGCYADFTLPSAPDVTQTRKINSIYYSEDDPSRAKSHDSGVDVAMGRIRRDDLMIIQGPLALNWKKRKLFFLPSIENAEVSSTSLPTPYRIDLWIKQNIHVVNKPEWIFVKVHTHGAQETNEIFFQDTLHAMYTYLEKRYNDGIQFKLHYVSARQMYNIIKAAEAAKAGSPDEYRDYELKKI